MYKTCTKLKFYLVQDGYKLFYVPVIQLFSRFPLDPFYRELWIRALRWENWSPKKKDVVCSDHFQEDQFQDIYETKIILKKDAVPSLITTNKQNTLFKKSASSASRNCSFEHDVTSRVDKSGDEMIEEWLESDDPSADQNDIQNFSCTTCVHDSSDSESFVNPPNNNDPLQFDGTSQDCLVFTQRSNEEHNFILNTKYNENVSECLMFTCNFFEIINS